MNPSENLVKNRNDLSPYLFHFTKGEDAYDKLVNILNQLKLISSNPQPIGFRGNLLVKRQKFFYCTYSLGITETS